MNFDIDGFEILEKIGEGGMASVWKARQLSLDRIVAIKVLSEVFSNDPGDVRRFQEEAQAAAKLKHPGIVQVHDAKAENGMYYFIMEYVSGYTVGDWVRRKGVLSEKDALLVADCVADALEYAWDHAGIVHCDIKPDNIIIDEDGTVKVADLGLARTISMMESSVELLDEIMGTPAYISPEQASGETNLDFRSDIYSLGAMLYHLVTGHMMFEDFDDDAKLEKHIEDTVADPIELNPQLSKGVCWLIERMTAKDPELRQSSWGAVRSDIRRVQHGHLPHGGLLPEGCSTVSRSPRRTVADYDLITVMQKRDKRLWQHSLARTAVVASIVAVGIIASVRMYLYHSGVAGEAMPAAAVSKAEEVYNGGSERSTALAVSAEEASPPVIAAQSQAVPVAADRGSDSAYELYEFAVEWYEEHPEDYETAIDQFKTVEEQTAGTKYSLMAKQKARDIEQARQSAIERTVKSMQVKVKKLVAEGRYDAAISLVANYKGPFKDETEADRSVAVKKLKVKKQEWLAEQRQHAEELQKIRQKQIDSLVMAVLADDLDLALVKLTAMLGNDAFADQEQQLKEVGKVLQDAGNINERILDSFRLQKGQTVDVYLKKGMRTLTIMDVSGNLVECRQDLSVGHGAVSIIKISVNDLSDYERLRRMGEDSDYDVALVKGIMAYQSNAYVPAEKFLGRTHPLLAKYLLDRLHGGLSTVNDVEDNIPAEESNSVSEPEFSEPEEPVFVPHRLGRKARRRLLRDGFDADEPIRPQPRMRSDRFAPDGDGGF